MNIRDGDRPTCFCGSEMHRRDGRYGPYFDCGRAGCDGRSSVTKAGTIRSPSDARTRRARQWAHSTFDQLWWPVGCGTMTRNEAYAWLRHTIKVRGSDAHISLLDHQQCRDVILALEREFGLEVPDRHPNGRPTPGCPPGGLRLSTYLKLKAQHIPEEPE